MIGNKLEQSIISIFQENLSVTLSINELAKRLKKAYPYINKKVNFFIKEDILRKIVIGKSYQCFLNLGNEKTRIYMAINELNKKESMLKHRDAKFIEIKNSLTKYLQENHFYNSLSNTIIMHEKKIFIILDMEIDKDSIYKKRYLKTLISDYDIVLFNVADFKNYLLEHPEILQNHIIMSNTDVYLKILSEIEDKLLSSGIAKRLMSKNSP